MKRILLLAWMLCLLVMSLAAMADDSPYIIVAGSVGRIKLGDNREAVHGISGEPKKTYDRGIGVKEDYWNWNQLGPDTDYSEVRVIYDSDKVIQVKVMSAWFSAGGISIQSTLAQVLQKYKNLKISVYSVKDPGEEYISEVHFYDDVTSGVAFAIWGYEGNPDRTIDAIYVHRPNYPVLSDVGGTLSKPKLNKPASLTIAAQEPMPTPTMIAARRMAIDKAKREANARRKAEGRKRTVKPVAQPKPKPAPKRIVKRPAPIQQVRLTSSQRRAAYGALTELRRLESAVKVGLTYADYSRRVVDAQIVIDEKLRAVPSGNLKNEIQDAMGAFANARSWWEQSIGVSSEAVSSGLKSLMQDMWTVASKRIRNAEKLLR